MALDADLVRLAFERSGSGCLLLDADLVVREAGPGAATLLDRGDEDVTGVSLAWLFPELQSFSGRLAPLTDDPDYVARFRIRRGEYRYLRLSVQHVDAPHTGLLALLEDVSLQVMRGEALSRHIHELESRCRRLEKTLIDKAVLEPSAGRYDAETGLLRSDALFERLVLEEGFSRRWGSPLSLLVLDYGENSPGRLTRERMDALRRLLRAGDAAGRAQRSLVVLVLPQTDSNGAAAVSERILHSPDNDPPPGIGIAELAATGPETVQSAFESARARAADARKD